MREFRTRILFTALAVAGGLISIVTACTLPAAGDSPTLDRSSNFTQAALTLDAQLTLAATGAFPTVTPLSTQTGTTIPVINPTTIGTPGSGLTPEPGAPCDRGAFVSDVSVPDGTTYEPGETFVKTWRLRNNGSCTWTPEYAVVFDNGDAMGGPASFPISPGSVPPGAEVDISINLTAPDEEGNYRGDWLLRNPAGQTFGLGTQGTASFWVIINVEDTPDFNLVFDNVHECDGTPTAVFRLSNTGSASLESIQITMVNQATGQTIYGPLTSNGPFMGGAQECPPGGDTLVGGSTGFIGGALAGSTTTGQTVEASFRMCSQDDLAGACLEHTIEFNVP